MHRIIKAHLDSFVASFGLEADDERTQFEKFATHCVVASRYGGTFDLDDLVTSREDEGIDAVAVITDELITKWATFAHGAICIYRRVSKAPSA
jgi:hypothetical protein